MKLLGRAAVLVLILTLCAQAKSSAQQVFFIFGHGVWANPSDKNFKDTHKTGLGVFGVADSVMR